MKTDRRELVKLAPLLALSGVALGWIGNLFPNDYQAPVSYALASCFGLLLGAAILKGRPRMLLLGIIAIPVYYIAVYVAVQIYSPANKQFPQYYGLIVYPAAGALGAALMNLAVSLWRREFLGALPRAIAAGLIGGLGFGPKDHGLAVDVLGHALWQIVVGLTLVDYGRRTVSGRT